MCHYCYITSPCETKIPAVLLCLSFSIPLYSQSKMKMNKHNMFTLLNLSGAWTYLFKCHYTEQLKVQLREKKCELDRENPSLLIISLRT